MVQTKINLLIVSDLHSTIKIKKPRLCKHAGNIIESIIRTVARVWDFDKILFNIVKFVFEKSLSRIRA